MRIGSMTTGDVTTIGNGYADQTLSEAEIREIVAQAPAVWPGASAGPGGA